MNDPQASSQVHTHDLSGTSPDDHPCRRGSRYERFRHRGWQPLREATYEALSQAGTKASTLTRFAQCGSFAHAWFSPSTKRIVVSASTCRNRWCEPCCNARRAKITSNLERHCEGRHLRLLTFTLQHHQAPLPDLLTRIWGSLKLLRRRKDWSAHVAGFAAFVHVKWSARSGWWHVHLHVLAEGTWWDSKELSNAWHTVTADSMVTDIREVTSSEGVRYAARYAAKPLSLADVPAGHRSTALTALHHRRLWLVGGSWKAFDLLATQPLPTDLHHLDTLDAIIDRTRNGDADAQAVLYAIVGNAVTWVSTEEVGANPFDVHPP